jgi:CRP-like cAMP-binding protein
LIFDSAIFLERFPWLADVALSALATQGVTSRRFEADENLLDCREPSPGAYLIRSGFACRYNMFPGGHRQIIGFVLPGDLCDSRATMFEHVDYSVSAIDTVEATLIPADTLIDRVNCSTSLLRAMCRLAAIEDAIDRQWLLNIGHRTALERVAHLLCEIFTRLQIVGLTRQTVCDLPLSQADIADATALTPVHVNRMLMELRRRGIISLNRRELAIHDFEALQTLASFTSNYLLARKADNRIPRTSADASSADNVAVAGQASPVV